MEYYQVPHGGVSKARNFGITKAKGEYIVFFDADDKLDKSFCQKTLNLLLKQKSDIAYVYTQMQHFEAANVVSQYPGFKLDYLKVSNFVNVCCLIKTEVARRTLFDFRLAAWEDWDFFLTLAEQGMYGVLLNEPLLYYRKHNDGKSALDSFKRIQKIKCAHILRTKHWRMYGYVDTLRHWVWYIMARTKHALPMYRDYSQEKV